MSHKHFITHVEFLAKDLRETTSSTPKSLDGKSQIPRR
jgi:hypothetical protein